MIIDCHGHYTTAPAAHQRFRDAQLAGIKDPTAPTARPGAISDDEIRESIEKNQLRLQQQRGSRVPADKAMVGYRASTVLRLPRRGGSITAPLSGPAGGGPLRTPRPLSQE